MSRGSVADGRRPVRLRRPGATLALVVAVVVAGVTLAVDAAHGPADATPVLGPGEVTVTLEITHSRFAPDRVRVRPGTLVRFVVVNHDPIAHELVVGPAEVHRRHAHGTEARHPPVPGEVSVGPHETGVTFLRFDEPGEVAMACHLPGHVEHGMVGTVEVVGSPTGTEARGARSAAGLTRAGRPGRRH